MSWESSTVPGGSGPHDLRPPYSTTDGAYQADARLVEELGQRLPLWAQARWLAAQAVAHRPRDSVAGARHRSAVRTVAEVFHEDLLAESLDLHGSLAPAVARVGRDSWVFPQWLLHERGALAAHVHAESSNRAVVDLARQWSTAPMGGYRVGGVVSGRLRVFDVRSARWHDALDLGTRPHIWSGWVIGRLVPSGSSGPAMFDRPPLPVPEAVARRVSRAAHGSWFGVLADSVHAGVLDPDQLLAPRGSMFTDVPPLSPAAIRRVRRLALTGPVRSEDAPIVGAAVIAGERLTATEAEVVRTRWGPVVPEPAAALLDSLVVSASDRPAARRVR